MCCLVLTHVAITVSFCGIIIYLLFDDKTGCRAERTSNCVTCSTHSFHEVNNNLVNEGLMASNQPDLITESISKTETGIDGDSFERHRIASKGAGHKSSGASETEAPTKEVKEDVKKAVNSVKNSAPPIHRAASGSNDVISVKRSLRWVPNPPKQTVTGHIGTAAKAKSTKGNSVTSIFNGLQPILEIQSNIKLTPSNLKPILAKLNQHLSAIGIIKDVNDYIRHQVVSELDGNQINCQNQLAQLRTLTTNALAKLIGARFNNYNVKNLSCKIKSYASSPLIRRPPYVIALLGVGCHSESLDHIANWLMLNNQSDSFVTRVLVITSNIFRPNATRETGERISALKEIHEAAGKSLLSVFCNRVSSNINSIVREGMCRCRTFFPHTIAFAFLFFLPLPTQELIMREMLALIVF